MVYLRLRSSQTFHMSLFSTYARIPIYILCFYLLHSYITANCRSYSAWGCAVTVANERPSFLHAGFRRNSNKNRFSLNSSYSASRRDGSINRPRKKVRRSKRSSLRKCTSGAAMISVLESVKSGHFHEVKSIRLPITSLPAYALLTIVCFFSALLEMIVIPLPEKSLSVSSARNWSWIRGRHEILDLVGPSLHSRRILHAPFVALQRMIHKTIVLIFLSPRDFLRATAISLKRFVRVAITYPEEFKAIRLIARRVKRSKLAYLQTKWL